MEIYLEPIKTALILFPFLAFLITVPYLLIEYRKYGSVPIIRSSIVYTFILYLLVAYFLVILPLPNKEEVVLMPTKNPQLIPFSFINDFISAFKGTNNILLFFKKPIVYTTLFNIILTIPFGIYLRYYFKQKLPKTILYTFLLSLYFELTQLTGLYGIYPKAYRLFDVDDLIINTIGGTLGYIITPIFTLFLPTREEIDKISYERGTIVSIYRRFLAFLVDLSIFSVLMFLLLLISNFSNFALTLIGVITIYYILIPTITKYTCGKYLVKIKLVSKYKNERLAILLRQILLYFIIVFGPIISMQYINYLNGIIILFLILFLVYSYFEIFLKFFGRKTPLLYEKITKTENISIVSNKNKEENEPSHEEENDV